MVKGKVQKYKVVEDKSKAFDFTKMIMERAKEADEILKKAKDDE